MKHIPVYSTILLILLTALFGLLIAPDKDLASNRLVMLTLGVFAFFLVVWGARCRDRLVMLGSLLLLLGVAAGILSLVSTDWSAGELAFPTPLSERFTALLRLPGSGVPNWADGINPRLVAGTMVLFLPLALSLALFAKRPALRWLGVLAGLVLLLPLYLSQSPQGLMALVLGMGLVFAWRIPWSLALQAGLALLAAGAWYFWHWGLPGSLVQRLLVGVQSRLVVWPMTLRMLQDMPFSGIGLNNLPVVQPLYDFSLAIQPHAHNVFLQTALDQGVIGLGAFLALFTVAFLAAWHAYRRLGNPDQRATVLGCAGGCAAFLGFGLWDCMTLGHKPAVALWAMLGLMITAGGLAGWKPRLPAWLTLKRVAWLMGWVGLMAAFSVPLWGSTLLVNVGRVLYNPMALPGRQVDEKRLVQVRWLADAAIRLNPQNGRAYLLAGLVELLDANDSFAVQALQSGLAFDSGDRYVRLVLADACNRLGEMDCALEHWRRAGVYRLLISHGLTEYQAGDYIAAQAWFGWAVQLDPAQSDGWLRLGRVYQVNGEGQSAKSIFEEIVARFPALSGGYEGLAIILQQLNEAEQAAGVIDKCLQQAQPPDAHFYYLRSRLAAATLDYPSSEHDTRHAIALQPNAGLYLAWLGELFQRQGRYDEALEQYSHTAQEASALDWVWQVAQRAGSVYALQGLWEQAISEYRQALVISQEQGVTSDILAQNYSALGNILLQSGSIVEAETAYRQALQLDPLNTEAFNGLEALSGE